MHDSVMNFVREIPSDVWKGKTVLEVGSFDVNGSVREIIQPLSAGYLGVDILSGPGVDKICRAENLVNTFGVFSFDCVISTEMLEHCRLWDYAIDQMKAVCREAIVVTTRSPGFPKHDHPADYWRFDQDAIKYAFREFSFTKLTDDPEYPGVFMFAERPWPVPDLSQTPYPPTNAPFAMGESNA